MSRLTAEHWLRLKEEADRVFSLNEVDSDADYYHMPSAQLYPSLFAWDSGFHSVALLHLDQEKAKRELETLFRQLAPDGHMPHENLLPTGATRQSPIRSFARWFVQWQYDSNGASHLVDPPSFV